MNVEDLEWKSFKNINLSPFILLTKLIPYFLYQEIQLFQAVKNLDRIWTEFGQNQDKIWTESGIIQIIKTLKEEEKKAYDYIKEKARTTKSDYAIYAQINDKKSQRILKKLVDVGLLQTEGKAKATKYVIAVTNTTDE